jgi:hypothetical protein
MRAPKVTGYLAGTVRPVLVPEGAGVEVGAVYGGVILNGWPARNIAANPFITEAAQETQPLWTQAYGRD